MSSERDRHLLELPQTWAMYSTMDIDTSSVNAAAFSPRAVNPPVHSYDAWVRCGLSQLLFTVATLRVVKG